MADKISVTNSSFKDVGTVFEGRNVANLELTIDQNTCLRVNKIINIEGTRSLAQNLGIPDVPPEHLKAFFGLLSEGKSQEEAVHRSRLFDYLKSHGIERPLRRQ